MTQEPLAQIYDIPWNNQNHRFSDVVQDFHPREYFRASDLCGIFAVAIRKNNVTTGLIKKNF